MYAQDFSTLIAVIDGYTAIVSALLNIGLGLVGVALVVSTTRQIFSVMRAEESCPRGDDRSDQFNKDWFNDLDEESKAHNGVKSWQDLRDL